MKSCLFHNLGIVTCVVPRSPVAPRDSAARRRSEEFFEMNNISANVVERNGADPLQVTLMSGMYEMFDKCRASVVGTFIF